MWGTHQGPVDVSWLCYGIFLCTDWTAWCFLVPLPPRIYQIHTPGNLEDRKHAFRQQQQQKKSPTISKCNNNKSEVYIIKDDVGFTHSKADGSAGAQVFPGLCCRNAVSKHRSSGGCRPSLLSWCQLWHMNTWKHVILRFSKIWHRHSEPEDL